MISHAPSRLSQRREQLFRLCVIAKCVADMHEDVFVSGREDKTSAELEWVFAQLVLLVSAGFGALAGFHVVAAQKMEDVGLLQLQRAIGFAIFIHQQGKLDVGFVAEEGGVLKVTQTDSGQRGSFFAELLFIFAQLRDVLSAEDSAIMPKEHHHGGAGAPQRSQLHRAFIHVRQRDFGKSAAVRFSHGMPLSWAGACVSRMNHDSFSSRVC